MSAESAAEGEDTDEDDEDEDEVAAYDGWDLVFEEAFVARGIAGEGGNVLDRGCRAVGDVEGPYAVC